MEDEDFVENFARMERWLSEGIDVAGAAYEEFITDIYQENKLMENELVLGGERVDLENIEMPVLQIVAEYDHLIPPNASKPFNDAIASEDTEVLEFPTGHIGMSVSSRSHDELWPQVCAWFEERSKGDLEAETESNAAEADPDESDAALAADAEGDETGVDDEVDMEIGGTDADEDLTDLSGVGEAYAEDLREAGIESIDDLAVANVADLATETGLSPGRIEDWIEQAASR